MHLMWNSPSWSALLMSSCMIKGKRQDIVTESKTRKIIQQQKSNNNDDDNSNSGKSKLMGHGRSTFPHLLVYQSRSSKKVLWAIHGGPSLFLCVLWGNDHGSFIETDMSYTKVDWSALSISMRSWLMDSNSPNISWVKRLGICNRWASIRGESSSIYHPQIDEKTYRQAREIYRQTHLHT